MRLSLGGVFSWRAGAVQWAAILSVLCFLSAAAAEVYLLDAHPDREWYDGRAVAESVKTLAWIRGRGGAVPSRP